MAIESMAHRIVLPVENEIVVLPGKASTEFSPGMLVVWDATNNYIEPISLGTVGLSDSVANIGANFAGVVLDGKLANDTTVGRPGSSGQAGNVGNMLGLKVAQVCIYRANCASTAFDHGDRVVGVTGATGNYTVAAGSTSGSVIGLVHGQHGTASTTVRVKLFGRLSSAYYSDRN